jgi:hypothetical protein
MFRSIRSAEGNTRRRHGRAAASHPASRASRDIRSIPLPDKQPAQKDKSGPLISVGALLALSLLAACGDGNSANPSVQAATQTCNTYGETAKNHCVEAMARGLNLNCQEAILGVETAMDQMDGKLFLRDDEAASHTAAQRFCGIYLDKLRDRYAKATVPSNVRATPPQTCIDLRTHVTRVCIDPLGIEKVDTNCSMWISTVAKGHDADVDSAEFACGMTLNLATR